ncbi:MAG: DUF1643 domain-containing protein [Thermoguttaceae bacterium]
MTIKVEQSFLSERKNAALGMLKCIAKEVKLADESVQEKNIQGVGSVQGKRLCNRNGKPEHRYYMIIQIGEEQKPLNEKNTLTVIMLNPSQKYDDAKYEKYFVDETVTNVIRIARCAKTEDEGTQFSVIEVLNLFSHIAPDPKKVGKQDNTINREFILKFLHKKEFNNPIMLAWGSGARKKDREFLQKVEDALKESGRQLYVFRKNKSGDKAPTHPSPRCRKYVQEFIDSDKKELKKYLE